ncbi:MAG TPA: hypothetical protein VLC46_05515 [Thermoanaerobaculia bacterium]|nr:hypothetical protein [Thermoanaerobaculia bacterium]
MSKMLIGVTCMIVTFVALNVRAQDPNLQYTRVLVPVVLQAPVAGALGSLWASNFVISNTSTEAVSVFPYYAGGVFCGECSSPLLPPTSTSSPFIQTDVPGLRGTFLYIDSAHIADVQMVLRVQDLSRALETWGTSVPLVREDRFRAEPMSIVDVTTDPQFRQTLRVYGLDGTDPTPVRLRLYGRNEKPDNPLGFAADSLLGEALFTLSVDSSAPSLLYPTRPAFLELSGLAALGGSQGYSRVRIEVTPMRDAKRVWAFVSVTDNNTQHMTVLEPLDGFSAPH